VCMPRFALSSLHVLRRRVPSCFFCRQTRPSHVNQALAHETCNPLIWMTLPAPARAPARFQIKSRSRATTRVLRRAPLLIRGTLATLRLKVRESSRDLPHAEINADIGPGRDSSVIPACATVAKIMRRSWLALGALVAVETCRSAEFERTCAKVPAMQLRAQQGVPLYYPPDRTRAASPDTTARYRQNL